MAAEDSSFHSHQRAGPMAARSSSTEELLSTDQLQIHGTRLDSPAYCWDDTDDDDDDCGPKPRELYGTFMWTIDNFSQIDNKELRSNLFDVGGHKWNMLIYPQGLDNPSVYLSLFLCVANHDELLPGWSQFAQFTLTMVNKDTAKSKYSEPTKEHDWGWRKHIELSRLPDGFLVDDVLTISAQVQVIRERVDRPFRCLDEPYRRELSRVYLTNVETIVQQFIDERKRKIRKSIDDERIWSRLDYFHMPMFNSSLEENEHRKISTGWETGAEGGFPTGADASLSAFWLGTDPSTRQQLTRENTDTILRLLVKYFFVEKEVTSTLLMDSLYAGLKVMKQVCKNTEDMVDIQWPGKYDSRSSPVVIIDKDNDMFVLADDVILLLERVALLDSGSHQPSADCRSSENSTKEVYTLAQVRAGVAFDDTLKQACRHLAAFSMDGSKGSQDLSNTSPENDDVRLIKLGWMALEFFFLAHVFSCIEAVHQEAMALKLQEELIEDEERKKK
ncbi:unnamed protein product [Urochloa decumbens]|uniref:MATH domain-containing protein n=1 Tax=Urochloa decumbens TaxID=240449 RepID=A0ABC9ALC9_9POAL